MPKHKIHLVESAANEIQGVGQELDNMQAQLTAQGEATKREKVEMCYKRKLNR